jgi:hypothetical protein
VLLSSVNGVELLQHLGDYSHRKICQLDISLWLIDYNGRVVKGDRGRIFPVHATNLYRWSRGIDPLNVDLDSGWR